MLQAKYNQKKRSIVPTQETLFCFRESYLVFIYKESSKKTATLMLTI